MTLEEYLGSKECDQWDMFWDDGEFLGEVNSIDADYKLYRLYDFFVELTTVPITGKGLRMMPFKSGPRLEKYSSELLNS